MATSTLELARQITPAGKVSFEEFIEWCDEDTWAEWVNGEIVLMPSPTISHQRLGSFLETVLRIYTETTGLGEIVRAPFVMKLAVVARGREPDILFIRREREHLIQRHYLDGPADLAIEIVSPESVKRDYKEKFGEYELSGVAEYWLIDPDHRTAEFYQLGGDGQYHSAAIETGGVYRSKIVAGFWLRVDWLWHPPAALDALRELKVM